MTGTTFDPSTVPVGGIAPDGAFADVPLVIGTYGFVRLPGGEWLPAHDAGMVSSKWPTIYFKREVVSTDEGTHAYAWRRVK